MGGVVGKDNSYPMVRGAEPPRLSRRPHNLRGWGNGNIKAVFSGSPGACGADGGGAPARVFITVGGDCLDCRQDRLHRRVVAPLGAWLRTRFWQASGAKHVRT